MSKIKSMLGFKKKKGAFDYSIQVFVPRVDSMQLQFKIDCMLERDKEDNLLYLKDIGTNGQKFKELFPGENKDIFRQEELPELKKKLALLKKQKPKTKHENPLNLKNEIYKYEYLISKYEQKRGAFVIENNKSEKIIFYLRKSTGLECLHFDISSNKAFSPTEKQSKDAFLSWKTKHENLKTKPPLSFEKITATLAAIVLLVLCLSGGYGTWKILNYDNELSVAKVEAKYICQDEILNDLKDTVKTDKETSNILNRFAEEKFGLDNIISQEQSPPQEIK